MRHPDWVARLREAVREHERVPFAWGSADCVTFAARCVDAITGSQWARTLEYGNRRGAARQLLSEGGLAAAVTARLGPPTPGHQARRGDICQVGHRALGVCSAAGQVRARTKRGLEVLPRARVRQHWRVE